MTTLTLAACGQKAIPQLSSTTSLETVFLKGDPITLLSGSTKNTDSFITLNQLEQFNNFSLEGISQFTEKVVLIEKEDTNQSTSPEAGNEAKEEDRTALEKSRLYTFSHVGNEYTYSSPQEKIDLIFTERLGKLELTGLHVDSGIYNLKALHYSLKNTGDAFSILAETQDEEDGKILLSFTFTKKSPEVTIDKTSSTYKYLYGAGVIVPWSQKEKVNINICGYRSSTVDNVYRNAIAQWNQALYGRLNIQTTTLFSYPPFSDLNTHCIYTVDNYLTETNPRFANMGTTYISGNLFQGKIIDADVMIWVKENEKFGTTLENTSNLQATVAHEIGHFLGLDHQFDKNITSIMSYARVTYVTSYDTEAIARLYPLL